MRSSANCASTSDNAASACEGLASRSNPTVSIAARDKCTSTMCPMHQSMQSRAARESSAQKSKLRFGRHICSVYMVQFGRSATPDFLPCTEQLPAATHCHQHHARVTFFVCYNDSATRTASKWMVPMAMCFLFSQASRISCDLPCGSTPYTVTTREAIVAVELQQSALDGVLLAVHERCHGCSGCRHLGQRGPCRLG